MKPLQIERRAYSFPLLGTRSYLSQSLALGTQHDVTVEVNPSTLLLLGFAEEVKASAREVIWSAFQESVR